MRAITAAAAVVAGVVSLVLSLPAPRLAETNSIVERSGNPQRLAPGAERCHLQRVTPDTAGVRIFASTAAGEAGPVRVQIRRAGRKSAPIASARVQRISGARGFDAAFEPDPDIASEAATVCVTNEGRRGVLLAGNETQAIGGGLVYVLPGEDDVRVDLLRKGEEPGFALIGAVAERSGLTRSSIGGPWMLYVTLVVIALLWFATIRTLLRWVCEP